MFILNDMDTSKSHILLSLGGLVRQRRTELGISQEELGYRAKLDRTYISGIERGVRNPTLTALVSLAEGLEVTVAGLVQNLEVEAYLADD